AAFAGDVDDEHDLVAIGRKVLRRPVEQRGGEIIKRGQSNSPEEAMRLAYSSRLVSSSRFSERSGRDFNRLVGEVAPTLRRPRPHGDEAGGVVEGSATIGAAGSPATGHDGSVSDSANVELVDRGAVPVALARGVGCKNLGA